MFLVSLFFDGAAQTKAKRVYIELNARYSITSQYGFKILIITRKKINMHNGGLLIVSKPKYTGILVLKCQCFAIVRICITIIS